MTRQGDAETRAALGFRVGRAINIDLPIMLFHDRIDQCEAQPCALAGVLSGEKWLEKSILNRLRNAAAFVFDDEIDGLFGDFAAYSDGAAGLRCVAGIGQQVDQYLSEALRVSLGHMTGVAEVKKAHLGAVAVE